jgi:hypothetical protein
MLRKRHARTVAMANLLARSELLKPEDVVEFLLITGVLRLRCSG